MIVALISPLVLGAALLGSPSVELPAMSEPIAAVTAVQAPQVETPVSVAPAQVSSGLPRQPVWAPTMAAYWPVFAGFAIVWVGIIGYMLTFGRRIGRVADSMTDLQGDGAAPPEGVAQR